jgi:hypothetical protein
MLRAQIDGALDGYLAGIRFRLSPSRPASSAPLRHTGQARSTRGHVAAMTAAALVTLLSLALGIGIPVALATTNPAPRPGQSRTIAMLVETYASLDEHAAGSLEECLGCR